MGNVKSADRKPEKYVKPDGKIGIRMVPVDKQIVKNEDLDEISLKDLTKTVAKSGNYKKIAKAHGADKIKKDLAMLRKGLVKESPEDMEPASPDEKSMAMRQAKFIMYVGEEIMEHLEQDNDFPEWMQNKLSALHQKAKDMHATMAGEYEDEEMEESFDLDEDVRKMSHGRLKFHMNNKHIPHGSYSFDQMKAERDRRLKTGQGDAYKKAKMSMSEEAEQVDEISRVDYKKHGGTFADLRKQAQAKVDKEINSKNKSTKKESVELDESATSGAAAAKMKADRDRKDREERRRKSNSSYTPWKPETAADRHNKWKADWEARRKARETKEEVELDEVLDTPQAMDSYRKKAKASKERAAKSAVATALRSKDKETRAHPAKDLKTIAKRTSGEKMADRAAMRKTYKALRKEEVELDEAMTASQHRQAMIDKIKKSGAVKSGSMAKEEYVNEKLSVKDGMGAWIDDFKKSDAPQFKGKDEKERRDMAIAAYLSAKRGAKNEKFVSAAQRKAVWATKADGGKGHPDNKGKKK